MQEYQQRVIDEKNELDVKCRALGVFIESTACRGLGILEQDRLNAQHYAMSEYSNVLGERIKAFNLPAIDKPEMGEFPKLPGTFPVVLYLGSEEDREELIQAMLEIHPHMRSAKVK